MNPAPLPIAVIGAGSIGQRHIEVAELSPLIDLVAVVEPHAPLRGMLAGKGLPMVAGIAEVPGRVRAAIIATPTPDHAASARACLDRGWAVLVEKPVAATLEAALAMVDHAERAGLPLLTGHHRRCHPFSIAAREALGVIGQPVGVQGLWSLRKHDAYYETEWRRRPGAGPLLTNLSHEIDLLRFFMGEIVEVSALLSSARRGLAVEDTASLAFRFDNGALGSFLISDAGASPWSFEAATGENPAIATSGEDYLRFAGEAGGLSFPSLTNWTRTEPGEIEWSKPLTKMARPAFVRVDPLREQIDRFAGIVAGKMDDVLCTGTEGVKALEMTLATALSARTGQPVRAGNVPVDFSGV